jgi:hypothetical protein
MYEIDNDSQIDPGIRDIVAALRAGGVETFESCEGGAGHAYHESRVMTRAQTTSKRTADKMLTKSGLFTCCLAIVSQSTPNRFVKQNGVFEQSLFQSPSRLNSLYCFWFKLNQVSQGHWAYRIRQVPVKIRKFQACFVQQYRCDRV